VADGGAGGAAVKLNPNKVGVIVECAVCGFQKAPIGRSVPFEMYLCDHECTGYRQEPFPGSLWPGESESEFGYAVGDDGTTIVAAVRR
jgi:hypothetical protein